MRTRSFRRTATVVAAWAVVLGCLPTGGAMAGPIASSNGKVKVTRDEDIFRIEEMLSSKRMAKSLRRRGIKPDELRQKLERMSDHEVHMLAERLETAKSGGDAGVTWTLVAIVLAVLWLVCKAGLFHE